MALNVLVVDDSAVMRAMVIKTLQLSGVPLGEIHQVGDGAAALAFLHSNWVDLIMLDISMPVMRGDDMLERLRAEEVFADLAVIVISSERSTRRIARMRELGAVFLKKPFAPEELRSIIMDTGVVRNEIHTR